MDSVKEEKRGLIDLHPSVFGVLPRLDIIQQNVVWQRLYRYVVSILVGLLCVVLIIFGIVICVCENQGRGSWRWEKTLASEGNGQGAAGEYPVSAMDGR